MSKWYFIKSFQDALPMNLLTYIQCTWHSAKTHLEKCVTLAIIRER
jgi:hypothetical protein